VLVHRLAVLSHLILQLEKNDYTIEADSPAQYYFIDANFGVQALFVSTRATSEEAVENLDEMISFPIYVKRGAPPSLDNSDASFNVSLDANLVGFSIPSPIPGRYYFAILDSFSTNVDVTFATELHVCQNNNFGPNCNITVVDLTLAHNVTEVNGTGDYQYFRINSTELLVGTGLINGNTTAPAIAASYVNLPSNDSSINSIGLDVNFIWTVRPDLVGQYYPYWLISVWANENETYYIWANSHCPNNCTNTNGSVPTGNCTISTGVCTCETGYSGLWCTAPAKHKLKAVWIVLIVIACVIILAVLVGVPVALYIRHRRRTQYESV